MSEAQNLGINLDSKSIEILKKVESLHRDSLINVAIALVEKTGYYRTLTGKNTEADLEDVASLDVEDTDEDSGTTSTSSKSKKSAKKAAPEKKAPSTSWDSF
ncbi:MAG: hypothetical protein U9N34_07730 [Candidatus Cloacimonadota bacterium]|nr:hypothetical protein [Candidatus Cloacimonadota bacterium]